MWKKFPKCCALGSLYIWLISICSELCLTLVLTAVSSYSCQCFGSKCRLVLKLQLKCGCAWAVENVLLFGNPSPTARIVSHSSYASWQRTQAQSAAKDYKYCTALWRIAPLRALSKAATKSILVLALCVPWTSLPSLSPACPRSLCHTGVSSSKHVPQVSRQLVTLGAFCAVSGVW